MFKYDMPKGILNLNLIQIFSTVGFAVLLGTLNLYLQQKGMPIAEVNTLTASFFALNFLLHFLGGALGGTYTSFRSLFVVSLLLQVAGLIAIASSNLTIILAGMGCFITGSGLNVSCINMMITQSFESHDMRRRTAFSVNYSCMNIGFLLSFVVANNFQMHNNYSGAFIFAASCVFIALLLHFFAWKHVADKGTLYAAKLSQRGSSHWIAGAIIVACFFVTIYLMHHPDVGSALVYVVFIAGFLYMLYIALQKPAAQRNKAIAYIVLMAAGLMYAFIQGLMATGLANFVKYNTTMSFLGMHIEPSGFNSFESISVIIFGFLLAKVIRKRHDAGKPPFQAGKLVATGLSYNIIAFLMVPFGIWYIQRQGLDLVPLLFPILLMVFVALAEIHVNAVNYSLAGELIQPRYQGIFTGYMFLNIAVGNNLAGPFSNLILGHYTDLSKVSAAQTNPLYMKMFFVMAVISAVVTLVYFSITRWLHRLKTTV
jgi:proton-dependent oligopeptide transporter, POT family